MRSGTFDPLGWVNTFTYLWLSLHNPNADTGLVAQLIEEAERRGQAGMVEKARVKAETAPIANAECGLPPAIALPRDNWE